MERLTQIFQNQEPSQQIQSCLIVLSEVHGSRQEEHDNWLLSLSLAWDHVEHLWNTAQIDLALYNRWQSAIHEHYDTVEQDLTDSEDPSIELPRHRLRSLSNGVEDPFNYEPSVSSRATPPRITPSPAPIPIDDNEPLAPPVTFADTSPQRSSTPNHSSLANAAKQVQDTYAIFCNSRATWQTTFITHQEHIQASLSTATTSYQSANLSHLDSRSTMFDAEKDASKSLIILQGARSDRDAAAAAVESHSSICRDKDRATDPAISQLLDRIDARINKMNNRLLMCEAIIGREEKKVAAALMKVATCRREEARRR
ncbi:MAG: hypothetical protein LQ345_002235 [Seirophora villosa]|nr:MAG: hypothetical protein LQ345_002235 [Seirophora villosa]